MITIIINLLLLCCLFKIHEATIELCREVEALHEYVKNKYEEMR